jgi:hypothetical protein
MNCAARPDRPAFSLPAGARRPFSSRRRAGQCAGWIVAAALLAPGLALADGGPTLLDVEVGDASAAVAALPSGVTATSAPAIPAQLPAAAPVLPGRSYPYVELHGYFRFRPDLIANGHLGQAVSSALPQYPVLTASSIKPPLSRWPNNNDSSSNGFSSKVGDSRDEDSISGATMRLRLQPTIHVADSVRLRLTVDVFDNYTFGASPDYSGALQRPDVPLPAFAMSTQPGVIRVLEAYGEWKTLFGLLRVGRQASNWGLGVLANGGMGTTWDGAHPLPHFYGGELAPATGLGYDADFSNFADRAAFVTQIKGTYIALFWDFVSQGALAVDSTRIDGVAYDLENGDDVNQWGFAVFRKPVSEGEIAARRRDLNDLRKPAPTASIARRNSTPATPARRQAP